MDDIPDLARPARELARQGLDAYQVAKRLFDPNDPLQSSFAVARALYSSSGLRLRPSLVARVLHHEKGLGLPPEMVAKVLHYKEGANLSPAHVARALAGSAGLFLPLKKIVPVLATITASDEAFFEATVPFLRWRYHRPEQHLALVEILLRHLPTERSLPLLAKALLADEPPLYSPDGLARFFAADNGLDLPPQSVVYALTHHDGPRLPLEQVARILTDDSVLGLRPNAAAEALACGAGLDHHQARRIIGDGMDSDHVPVLQRDEGDLKLARAVPANPLVR